MVGRYKATKATYTQFYNAYKKAKTEFYLKAQKVDKGPIQMRLPLKFEKCNIMV